MRIHDQFRSAFTALAMRGYVPTAFVVGEDDWQRLIEADGVAESPGFGLWCRTSALPARIMDCSILLSPKVGGILAVTDDMRHTLQATGRFEVLP